MNQILLAPVTFYALTALAFAVLVSIGVIGCNLPVVTDVAFFKPGTSLIDKEQDYAASVGIPWQTWVALRLALLVIGGFLGYASQLPVIAILALAGSLGLPVWLVRYRASKRILQQNEGAKQRLQQIVSQVGQARIPVDQALRHMGVDAPPALREVLAPLRGSSDLRDALVEVAERGRTAEMEQIVMQLLLARSRDPKTMLESIQEVLIPRLDGDLAVDRNLDKLMSGQRWNTIMMVAITGSLFLIFDSTESFHNFYASVLGQASLVIAILIVTGMVALLNQLTRPPARVRWAVRRLVELEAASNA
jgi:hypothetical protein